MKIREHYIDGVSGGERDGFFGRRRHEHFELPAGEKLTQTRERRHIASETPEQIIERITITDMTYFPALA